MVNNETTLDIRKQELADIDARIRDTKATIQLGKDLETLHEMPEFQSVLLNGYLCAEAERIFGVLTDSTHNLKRDSMENLMDKLTSIRNVKQFFGVIMQSAEAAKDSLEDEEAYRLEVTARDSIIEAEIA